MTLEVQRMVLATDFSPGARAALEHAIAIAARFGARLYLFHSVEVREKGDADAPHDPARVDDFYELAERRAREELEALRGRLEGAPATPVSIVECVRIGVPADEIVAFAEEKGADLIVVGTHGRTGLKRVLVGSVAESVVRRAPCPVLAVRVTDEEEAQGVVTGKRVALDRIVCAIDSSDSSRAALRAADELARRFGAGLVAANVVDDYALAQAATLSQLDSVAIENRLLEIARASLDRCVVETLGAERAREVKRTVEVGRPAESIAHVATIESAGLVCCGTHGRSGLSRALFGSVAERILRVAPCPVLTVREGRAAARLAA